MRSRKEIKPKLAWKGEPRSYSSIIEGIRNEVGQEVDSEYLGMSDDELDGLPAEDGNGICFYEVGEILLGKEALIRFVKNNRKNNLKTK